LSGLVDVLYDSGPEQIRRHGAKNVGRAGVAAAFIVEEEEGPVLDDRSAYSATEHVDQKRGAWDLGSIVKKIVSRGDGVAMIFVKRSVVLIGSTAGHEGDLGTRASTKVGVSVRCRGAELL